MEGKYNYAVEEPFKEIKRTPYFNNKTIHRDLNLPDLNTEVNVRVDDEHKIQSISENFRVSGKAFHVAIDKLINFDQDELLIYPSRLNQLETARDLCKQGIKQHPQNKILITDKIMIAVKSGEFESVQGDVLKLEREREEKDSWNREETYDTLWLYYYMFAIEEGDEQEKYDKALEICKARQTKFEFQEEGYYQECKVLCKMGRIKEVEKKLKEWFSPETDRGENGFRCSELRRFYIEKFLMNRCDYESIELVAKWGSVYSKDDEYFKKMEEFAKKKIEEQKSANSPSSYK